MSLSWLLQTGRQSALVLQAPCTNMRWCKFAFASALRSLWLTIRTDIRDLQNSHLIYTIPIAIALTIILGPLFTRRDVYKILFLQVVAVSYTIPWYVRRLWYSTCNILTPGLRDSYLIRTKVWSTSMQCLSPVSGLTSSSIPSRCHNRTKASGHPC